MQSCNITLRGKTVAWNNISNILFQNKYGLVYADLDLVPCPSGSRPCPSGSRFVIRGIENRNNYAIIDHTETAEPLPSVNDDDEKHDNNVSANRNEPQE